MTTSSADIDSFIRFQKEKLSRDRSGNSGNLGNFQNVPNQGYYQPPLNQNLDYNRQLENYLNLPRKQSDPSIQFRQQEQYDPRSQSPLLLAQQQQQFQQFQQFQQQQQQQQPQQNNRQFKENEKPDDSFFQKFGSNYDAQKNKLNNERNQEYNNYLQKKNSNDRQRSKNQAPTSDEFYATLPLGGLGAPKENAKTQRNFEYQMLKEKIETSNRRGSIEWWKDRNEPEIKPYSKHVGSQENLSNLKNSPFSNDQRSKSHSQFEVNTDRRLQSQPDPRGYDPNYDFYRARSANSFENINRAPPIEAWRTSAPPPLAQSGGIGGIDPSLADILRRPPVGLKSGIGQQQPQIQSRVQFNDNVRYTEFPPNQIPIQEPPRNYNYNNNSNNNANSSNNNTKDFRFHGGPNAHQYNNPSTLSGGDGAAFNFSEDQNKNAKAIKTREYQEELQRQVREKQFKKQKEKEEQDRLDRKIEIENSMYNPYGRGGGGAPIRDKDGLTVADLRHVKNDPSQFSPRDLPPSQAQINNIVNNSSRANSNEILHLNFPPQQQQQPSVPQIGQNPNRPSRGGPNEEPTFARGGNGIFGEAKSDERKKKDDIFKAELQKQVEENQRLKAMEKEKLKLEEEKQQKRIDEDIRRMKLEQEEEEKKRREREENERKIFEEKKRILDEKKSQGNDTTTPAGSKRAQNKKLQRNVNEDIVNKDQSNPPAIIQTDFRSNSPPLPAVAKKLNNDAKPAPNNSNNLNKSKNIETENRAFSPPPPKPTAVNKNKPKSNATADYYITESRLNVSSPPNKKISSGLADVADLPEERVPSTLINDYENKNFKETAINKKIPALNLNLNTNKTNRNNASNSNNTIPTKPLLRKVASRPTSQVSNSEVLTQLQNLKKHLHNELAEVENQVHNANDRTTVGQLSDIHQNILNVRTPPGDRFRRDQFDYGPKTYRKDVETPPLNGGLEPRTYFRDNTILLGPNKTNDLFTNDLQREANTRQLNRLNTLHIQNDAFRSEPINDQLSAQNQLRLKKLRDLEGDSLSMTDPADVLNKFMSRNNRQPSAATIHDDTWSRQPV